MLAIQNTNPRSCSYSRPGITGGGVKVLVTDEIILSRASQNLVHVWSDVAFPVHPAGYAANVPVRGGSLPGSSTTNVHPTGGPKSRE